MDIDDFRSVVEATGVDVWTFIDTAITVAATDYGEELKLRRDKIVEALYTRNHTSSVSNVVINGGHGEVKVEASRRGKEGGSGGGDSNGNNNDYKDSDNRREGKRGVGSPSTPPWSVHGEDGEERDDGGGGGGRGSGEEEDELDPYGGLFDDEQKKILDIKQQLEDPDQAAEDTVVDLLQCLADMDITFPALKETDIGRNVNRLRKHPSNDVRRLVKQLVRKWKEIVDEWVRLNPQGDHSSSALMADGDSPQQKVPQSGHHQVPDFAYSPSPNLNNGSSRSDNNNSEPERKQKPILRKESPIKPARQPFSASASAPHNLQRQREQPEESNFDADDRLALARKRLQANYKEAENAKRQRTIQVMDIHEVPKPKNAKNTFFAKNKGGGSQGRHR